MKLYQTPLLLALAVLLSAYTSHFPAPVAYDLVINHVNVVDVVVWDGSGPTKWW